MQYNFYGFLTLELKTEHSAYLSYFENEYRRINEAFDGETAPTTITVHVVSELPPAEPGDIRREVFFKRLFHYAYVVRDLRSDHVHVYFRRHFMEQLYVTAIGVFLQAQVLEPIMYMKLLERGVLFMHSAGVADEEHGYVFPAYGGTGKTTLSLALVGEGFKLLGDDLLLIDPDSQRVFPYPRPLHLFTYNINSLMDAAVPLRIRSAIRFKNVLRLLLERLTGQELLISTRVHVDEIYDHVHFSPPVKLRTIKFLKREGEDELFILKDDAAREDMARRIVASADLNESLYENIIDNEELAREMRRLELEVTMEVLRSVDEVELINTRKLNVKEGMGRFVEKLRA